MQPRTEKRVIDERPRAPNAWTRARHAALEPVLAVFRVMTGLLFMQHGAQKMFGLLGGYRGEPGATADFLALGWVAGILEFFGGLLVAIGLFTAPVAFMLSGLMAVAYFKAHAPGGFWPILNRGELAALFSFAFLAIWVLGGGRYSLDAVIARRKNS